MEGKGAAENSGLSGMTADRADAEIYQRRVQHTPKTPAASGNGIAMLFVLLLVLGAGLVYVGWQERSERRQVEGELRQELMALHARMGVVSTEISSTGESLTEVGSETDKQIRFLDGEVRKLWDLTNKRHKKEIADNEAAIVQSQGKLAELQKSVTKVQSAVAADAKTADAVNKEMAALSKEFSDFSASLKKNLAKSAEQNLAQQSRLDQVAAQVRGFQQTLLQLQGSQTAMDAALEKAAGLSARIESNEGAVRSIDSFRKQTNLTLTQLQSALNALQKDVEEMNRAY